MSGNTARIPTMREIEAQAKRMPDGPEKDDMLRQLASLKGATAAHKLVAGEIRERRKGRMRV